MLVVAMPSASIAALALAMMDLGSMPDMVASTLLGLSISEIHFVAPLFSVGGSFLPTSCGHPQVQTVPSSQGDAPCPVVTPSRMAGLARRYLSKQQRITNFRE